MKSQTLSWMICTVALGLLLSFMAIPAEARSAVCFDCHDEDGFKGENVHAPVSEGNCELCHSPHVSKYEGLLVQNQKTLCLGCHTDIKDRLEQNEFVHQPLQKGDCVSCHAPHQSDNPALLRYDLSGACYDCHDEPDKPVVGHQPFLNGECDACHDPHSSTDARLLKTTGAELCLGCHSTNKELSSKHLGREMTKIDCLSCHNPHGSNTASLVRNVAHRPFAEKSCGSCHGQEDGINMCLQCHEDTLPSFNKIHNHLRGNGEVNPCITCHNPHAGDKTGMLSRSEGSACRSCHEDTFIRHSESLYKHADWETCSNCHSLHGSDHFAMMKDEPSKVCSECHEEHSSFTHPLGDDARDPRTKQGMTCISCHDANAGTKFKYFLLGGAEKGLCVQCHKGY